jgi:spermidine synthase
MSAVAFARVLSFCVGFLSLSQEILFVRLSSYAYESLPSAFAFVLVFFLLGIALGANAGKRICARGGDLRLAGGRVLLAAALFDALVPPVAAFWADSPYAPLALGALILVSAALKSVLFPIAHELGSTATGADIGRSISKVYASNIAGSTLGPLVTGFVLLNLISLEHAFRFVAIGTGLLGAACVMRSNPRFAGLANAVCAAVVAWAVVAPVRLVSDFAMRDKEQKPPNLILETRSGIVHTLPHPSGGDAVYGSNVYDGRINTDLRVNSNGINRAYVLAALHPNPARVLVLGLSSGSWTRVLAQFPGVERIDVVEINPGYLDLIRRHPEVAPILDDPRIRIDIDDARRWLIRHPDRRYDLIVMNTSFYWRAYATNLLSREFLQLARRHLAPGGVMTYNTTSSPDVLWTARDVFPFVRRYVNFAYVAEHDFTAAIEANRERVWSSGAPGQPLLRRDSPEDVKAVDKMLAIRFVTPESVAKQYARPLEVITDDNMVTEFRYGRGGLFSPSRSD